VLALQPQLKEKLLEVCRREGAALATDDLKRCAIGRHDGKKIPAQ
jgi:hypothetical protein